ncbi:hypothetical protein Chor_012705, partial [Crotalus horridus]
FYVLENSLEAVSRQLLFLNLALEPPDKMGLQEKSEIFLELMGNTLLRSQTTAYLQEKAALFIRYITDSDFQLAKLPVLDFSALKFRERDQLEAIFQFWQNPEPQAFQIKQLWDLRLQQYLGTRYDSRCGVCDWDLTMKLHEHGKGEPIPAQEYWGDISTSPYITFGIEAEDPSLLKTINGCPSKASMILLEGGGGDAQEISLQIVTALFYELRYNTRYDPSAPSEEGKDDHLQGGGDCTTLVQLFLFLPLFTSLCLSNALGLPATEEVCVYFLPLDCLPELHHKVKYQQLFNLFFFSCSFLPDLRKEQVSEFSSRVTRLATDAGFVPVETDKKHFSLFQLGDQEVGDNPHEIMPP